MRPDGCLLGSNFLPLSPRRRRQTDCGGVSHGDYIDPGRRLCLSLWRNDSELNGGVCLRGPGSRSSSSPPPLLSAPSMNAGGQHTPTRPPNTHNQHCDGRAAPSPHNTNTLTVVLKNRNNEKSQASMKATRSITSLPVFFFFT